MMHFKYRWIYAVFICVIVLLFGYYYMIGPDVETWRKYDATEKKLREKLSTYRAQIKRTKTVTPHRLTPYEMQANDLSRLLVHLAGLTVQAMGFTTLESEQINRETVIHLVVQGSYRQIIAFLFALMKDKQINIILDFALQEDERNKYKIAIDILMLKKIISLAEDINLQAIANPFCLEKASNLTAREKDLAMLQQTPLAQIRMIGYLQQARHSQGLIVLPNGSVMALDINTIVGKEHGKTIAILADRIIFTLPDHTRFVLRM